MTEEFNTYTKIINKSGIIVNSVRCQDYRSAMNELTAITEMLVESADTILQNTDYYNQYGVIVTPEIYVELIENITKAQEREDYIYLADLFETQLIPLFEHIQDVIKTTRQDIYDDHDFFDKNREHLVALIDRLKYKESKQLDNAKKLLQLMDVYNEYKADVIDYSEYIMQSALNGELTLEMGSTGIHMHSTVNPTDEAAKLAQEYYGLEYNNYIVWGIGLGYHVKALLNIYTPQITVIEPDIDMIMLALMNMEFEELRDGRLQIICDSDYTQLVNYISGSRNERVVIYAPELRHVINKNRQNLNEQKLSDTTNSVSGNKLHNGISEEELLRQKRILEKINQVFIRDSSVRNNEKRMNLNFHSNTELCTHYVDELKNRFRNKRVIIVAAGPSLDKNVEQLKNIDRASGRYVILAVGTVFRKLLNMGIKPDFVIIIESNDNILKQIDGVQNTDIPLLLLSTAYRELAKTYPGPKYLIDQHDYEQSEEHAKKHGYRLYSTGGSVTTTATSVAATLGAERIIFIGFDLSYPHGVSHANGTLGKKTIDTTGFIEVKSVDGGIVYATNVFNIYRNWIENEIKKYPGIRFIDATEGGAKIEGTKIMTLKDAIR